jgi:hypothetical protein
MDFELLYLKGIFEMAYPKESVEAAQGLIALAKVLAEAAKDGLQFSDITSVAAKLSAEPLKSKIDAAKNGLDKVQGELQAVNIGDAFAVISILGPELVELVHSLGKK